MAYEPMTIARLGELLASCAEVFPDEPIPKRSELLLDELFGIME